MDNIDMLPDSIDNTNFKYLIVDNKYVASLCIKSLPERIYFLDVLKDLDKNVDYDMSLYLSKLDSLKTLNNITYNISLNLSELYTVNRNQRNIDVINKSNEDAKNLRKKIQIENQDIYNLSIIFTFYSTSFNQLLRIISNFKAKLYSKTLSAEITNFRHLDFYLMNLPLSIENTMSDKLYITTDAIANLFPFYSNYFMDIDGSIIGYTKSSRRLCMVNIFSEQYENSNMCIFGSSGSGKSFFTKLFIIRNFFAGKRQIIFDIENEYEKLCDNLKGQKVFDDTYFNILQITKKDMQKKDFLDSKIKQVVRFIKTVTNCVLDDSLMYNELELLYEKFGITSNENSVYKLSNGDKVYLDNEIIEKERFPTLNDLKKHTKCKELKEILKVELNNSLKFFSKTTNIDLFNYLYVINVKNIIKNPNIIVATINSILNEFLNDKETIIYIDEMWKYAMNENILECITNMYKTIRKRKASIITITQDITDFFSYKEGFYASSILNNSCFKIIFKTGYKDSNILNEICNIKSEKLSTLKKGDMFFMINRNSVQIQVNANDYERELLDEDDNRDK